MTEKGKIGKICEDGAKIDSILGREGYGLPLNHDSIRKEPNNEAYNH